jgi:multidrug efflux pump subunit AcrB
MPVSVVGAFVALSVFGQTLNVMTLGGLALSIGVLVDNAIVVVEVILAKQERGLSVPDSVIQGAGEVAMPVLASTLATLVVFVPAFFLQGILQTLFIPLAISVIAVLGISYFASMMIIPVLAGSLLDLRVRINGGALVAFRHWFDRVTHSYGRSLQWALPRSRSILRWSIFLHFGVAIGLIGWIGFELFPRSDAGSFTISFRAPSGLRVEKRLSSQHASKLGSAR